MRQYGFENENGTSLRKGLHFLEFPVFNYGKQVVESKDVPGRIGTVTIKKNQYTDTTITNVMEFKSNSIEGYEKKSAEIREWLNSTAILSYTDMQNWYFVVKKVDITSIERKYGLFGKITVVFTCEPSIYHKEGDLPIETNDYYNEFSWAQPNYKITGEGLCTLTVNGNAVTANISGNLTINTEKMISYREDGQVKNTSLIGDYEDLYLQSGENTVAVTEGFVLDVIPKWRRLP